MIHLSTLTINFNFVWITFNISWYIRSFLFWKWWLPQFNMSKIWQKVRLILCPKSVKCDQNILTVPFDQHVWLQLKIKNQFEKWQLIYFSILEHQTSLTVKCLRLCSSVSVISKSVTQHIYIKIQNSWPWSVLTFGFTSFPWQYQPLHIQYTQSCIKNAWKIIG